MKKEIARKANSFSNHAIGTLILDLSDYFNKYALTAMVPSNIKGSNPRFRVKIAKVQLLYQIFIY